MNFRQTERHFAQLSHTEQLYWLKPPKVYVCKYSLEKNVVRKETADSDGRGTLAALQDYLWGILVTGIRSSVIYMRQFCWLLATQLPGILLGHESNILKFHH